MSLSDQLIGGVVVILARVVERMAPLWSASDPRQRAATRVFGHPLPNPTSSAASARSADRAGAVSVTQSAPAPAHPSTAASPHAAASDPAAGVNPPPSAAGSLTWEGWALPAILEVLAEHRYVLADGSNCTCHRLGIFDPYEWREHVAPLIAARIACDPTRAMVALAAAALTRCQHCQQPIHNDTDARLWVHTATDYCACTPRPQFPRKFATPPAVKRPQPHARGCGQPTQRRRSAR